MVETGFIRRQKNKKSQNKMPDSFKTSRTKKSFTKNTPSFPQSNSKTRIKVLDYNYKFNESQDLIEKIGKKSLITPEATHYTKQQGTQSRAIPIEPICMSGEEQPISPIEKKKQITLKDGGQEGYVQVNEDDDKVEHPNDLKFLWEENYLESKDNQLCKSIFFLE